MKAPSILGYRSTDRNIGNGFAKIGVYALLSLSFGLAGCGLLGFGAKPAKVNVKFDITGGDNSFAATVYVQEVDSGETRLFPTIPIRRTSSSTSRNRESMSSTLGSSKHPMTIITAIRATRRSPMDT